MWHREGAEVFRPLLPAPRRGIDIRMSPGALLLLLAAVQDARPINADCPVKPGQKARAAHSVVYKGRILGLC